MRNYKNRTDAAAFSILTLDDDPIMTATVQAYFQRSGYLVDVENDPTQAIERIRQGSYDILLLDFLMAPICGDQVVEQVRQFNHDIFIILLTGHKSMAPPIKTIRALDIQGYYEKSDRFDQLELLVESCAKSLRQMRTVKSYKDGLSSMMEALPRIHNIRSMERIAESILQTVSALLDCNSVTLTLDAACYQGEGEQGPPRGYISRAVGQGFQAPDDSRTRHILELIGNKSSLVQEQRLFFPMLDDQQQPMGLLSVELPQPPQYDQVQLMEVFARQASAAIGNAAMHALVQTKNKELDIAYSQLKAGYLEMVSAMRLIVDAKDIYTRGHSDRVSWYGVQLAKRLGRDPAYCERLKITGLFHDIGKLGVPDGILLKDSGLTDEEYDVIKSHPQNGADILSVITQFRDIVPGVLGHHERYDGRGYPQGLCGEDIAEEARIITVADAFDAMTSDRQYRKSLGFERALDELERGRGTQFDPELAAAFIAMAREEGFSRRVQDNMPREGLEGRSAGERELI